MTFPGLRCNPDLGYVRYILVVCIIETSVNVFKETIRLGEETVANEKFFETRALLSLQ